MQQISEELLAKVFFLMVRLEKLKRTDRTGWNLKFADGEPFKSRTVKEAESVADHTWLLALLALMIGSLLKMSSAPNLDVFKLVWMALIHDTAELITRDRVTATIVDQDERARLEAEKRALEDAALQELFLPLGDWGFCCYQLSLEFEDQTSPEARVLRELDKFECALQAVLYCEQGNDLDPEEFLKYAERFMNSPEMVELMRLLRERAAAPT